MAYLWAVNCEHPFKRPHRLPVPFLRDAVFEVLPGNAPGSGTQKIIDFNNVRQYVNLNTCGASVVQVSHVAQRRPPGALKNVLQ